MCLRNKVKYYYYYYYLYETQIYEVLNKIAS